MKLVRKNEEFIVIENNGSYHKVALNELDALIVLLCEAKQVDPAKANKSIGEDLFEDQERTARVFTPYIESLHRDYERTKRVMKLTVSEVWDRLREAADHNKDVNPLEFGNKFFHVPEDLLLGHNALHVPIEPYLPRRLLNRGDLTTMHMAVDPALKGNLTMNILKGRQMEGKEMKFTVDLEAFMSSRIPKQYWGHEWEKKTLRNPLLVASKRISQSDLRLPAVVYRPVLTVYNDHMAKLAIDRYVATAFPKRFDRNNVLLPVRYTKDVAYFVLEEGCAYDVSSINDIRKSAVKAWEC